MTAWTTAVKTARDTVAANAATATGPRQTTLNNMVFNGDQHSVILARHNLDAFNLLFTQPNGPAELKRKAELLATNSEQLIRHAYNLIGVQPPLL